MTAKLNSTEAGFAQAVAEHGADAKGIERKRLSVFEELAQPDDYEDAER